mgnify:CR=1 FL=1
MGRLGERYRKSQRQRHKALPLGDALKKKKHY